MARITDGQRYGPTLRNELHRLADAEILDADRQAIRRCVEHADAVDDLADATLKQLALYCRLAAERSTTDAPLTEWALADVDALCFTLKHEHDLSAGSISNYRKVLKRFFRFHGRSDLADSFVVGAQGSNTVDTDDILTQAEIDALFDAASNTRAQAILALLLDMGLRVGALTSLRIGDVTLTDTAGTIEVNTEGNVKGAGGTLPITWSRGYLVRWLNVHPRADNDDAALICALSSARHQSGTDDGAGALTTSHVRQRLYGIAERAGLDRKRAKPHRFRKTAVSQWVRDGLPEQDIKHRACWTPDSQQLDTYSHVTDDEFNERVLDHYGLAPDDEASASPTLSKCPQCESSLRANVNFCPNCACPLDTDAAAVAREQDAALRRDLVSETGQEATALAELGALLDEYPELRGMVDE